MSNTTAGKGKAARGKSDELRFDRRLLGRRDGVSPQELKRHLASLPDLSGQAETVPLPGSEEAAPGEATGSGEAAPGEATGSGEAAPGEAEGTEGMQGTGPGVDQP